MSASPDDKWTPEKKVRLAELWATDMSTSVIAQHLHVSKNAVVGTAHRLKLPARPSPILPSRGPQTRSDEARQGRYDSAPLPPWHPIVVEVFRAAGLPVP
jgi:GcrA cell cycle regulator